MRALLLILSCLLLALHPGSVAARHELVTSFDQPPKGPAFGPLTLGPDGYYWGTTYSGGTDDGGTVYKVKADGSQWSTVFSFQYPRGPQGGLVYDGAGFM